MADDPVTAKKQIADLANQRSASAKASYIFFLFSFFLFLFFLSTLFAKHIVVGAFNGITYIQYSNTFYFLLFFYYVYLFQLFLRVSSRDEP